MEPMTSTERIFFRLERDGFPIDVVGITVLAGGALGPVPFAAMRATMADLVDAAPYLTRRVSRAPLGIGEDHWVAVGSVDLDDHVRRTTCPAPGDDQALVDHVLELTKDPLDRRRPLWEAWFVEGLADGRTALVMRGHHALTDGLGFLKLYQSLFDTEPPEGLPIAPLDEALVEMDEAAEDTDDAAAEESTAQAAEDDAQGGATAGAAPHGEREPNVLFRAAAEVPERVVVNALTGVRIARQVVAGTPEAASLFRKGVIRRVRRVPKPRFDGVLPRLPRLPRFIPSFTSHPPVTRFNRHVSDPTKTMAVLSLPLAEVEEAREAHPGATVNDVILTILSGSLRAYLEPYGEVPRKPLVTTCPVNVRRKPGRESSPGSGNAFTAIWIELPVHLRDAGARLAFVHAGSSRAKGGLSTSRAAWDLLSDVGDLLLPGLVSAAMEFAGSRPFQLVPPTLNLSTSTMRGSATPLYLAGHPVEHVYARTIICPPVHLFVHAITYVDQIDMGVLSVAQIVPDPQRLTAGMRAELDVLLELARARREIEGATRLEGAEREA